MPREDYDQGLQELQRIHARDSQRVIIARAEGTEFVLIAAGSYTEVALDWERIGSGTNPPAVILEQINAVKDAGTAATFDLQIRAKAAGVGLDLIYEDLAITPPYLNRFAAPGIGYVSEEVDADRGKLYLAIQPIGGTLTLKVRILGRPLR